MLRNSKGHNLQMLSQILSKTQAYDEGINLHLTINFLDILCISEANPCKIHLCLWLISWSVVNLLHSFNVTYATGGFKQTPY